MKKVGFVFSGAGARIPQLYVLSKNLITGNYLNPDKPSEKGVPVIPNVIAGASSGALNAVAVNAILSGKYSWDKYEKDLVVIRNTPFDKDHQPYRTIYSWIPGNLIEGYVLQTHINGLDKILLYNTIKSIFNGIGIYKLGDLDKNCPVYISAVNRENGKTIRFCSTNKDDANLDVVDVLMASTAIPVVFPQRTVNNVGDFVDGGTGQDSVPSMALANEKCDTLWLVCRQGVHSYNVSHADLLAKAQPDKDFMIRYNNSALQPNKGLQTDDTVEKSVKILDNAVFALEKFFADMSYFQLETAKTIANEVYTYIPILDKEYSMINFNEAAEQIKSTLDWSTNNPPIRIK